MTKQQNVQLHIWFNSSKSYQFGVTFSMKPIYLLYSRSLSLKSQIMYSFNMSPILQDWKKKTEIENSLILFSVSSQCWYHCSRKRKKETKKSLKFSISPLIIHIIIRSKAAIVLFKEKTTYYIIQNGLWKLLCVKKIIICNNE